jgi:cysteine desulfurase/selenocysteine lyase
MMADSIVHQGVETLRQRILGVDREVPLLDGSSVPYVNLDNAASTPPLLDVVEALDAFLPFYASVHRGTGFKSRLSTDAYDQAHSVAADFFGADPQTNAVAFGKNTTEAINQLSYRVAVEDGQVVITTQMEHHSDDLPWRRLGRVIHVGATPDGRMDEDEFDRQLEAYAGRIALVAVSGASNVTGFIQPIHDLARKAHRAGARILVDAAQLAPHRSIDMLPDDDPAHLDFLAISAHKMYAPYGSGALIGPKDVFLASAPEYRGGGTIDVVTLDQVVWAGLPDREEAGSPNVVGAVAMAVAMKTLDRVGMDAIAEHEASLVRYALERLADVPGIRIYGDSDPARAHERVGVIPFNLDGHSHFEVAAILGYEGGIGVRSGCFCAHPYVIHLLGLSSDETAEWRRQMLAGDRTNMPGMVRASFGCYNNTDDVDRMIEMLRRIVDGDVHGRYQVDSSTGEYVPADHIDQLDPYFSL